MKYKKCEICSVRSERKDGKKRFFIARFPLDEARCKKWVQVTGNEDLAYIPIEKLNQLKYICGNHFKATDFHRKKTKLKSTPIPSIRLTRKPLSDDILLTFPYHLFREPKEQVPSTSAVPPARFEAVEYESPFQHVYEEVHVTSENIQSECGIPSVGCLMEVETSEKDCPSTSAVPPARFEAVEYDSPFQHVYEEVHVTSENIQTECGIPSVGCLMEVETSEKDFPSTSAVPPARFEAVEYDSPFQHVYEEVHVTSENIQTECGIPSVGCLMEVETSEKDFPSTSAVPPARFETVKIEYQPVYEMGHVTAENAHPEFECHKMKVATSKKRNPEKDVTCTLAVTYVKGTARDNNSTKATECVHAPKRRSAKKKTASNILQLSPRKKKLVKKLTKCRLMLKSLRQRVKILDSIKSKALNTMLFSALKNQNRCAQGKRWSKQDKTLAIAMYKKSPKLYRYIRTLIPLPSERTLQNVLSKMPIQPGVNNVVIKHLSRKAADFSPKNKTCVLMFDEMSLKKRLIYNPANDIVEGYQDLGEHGRTEDLADKALVLLLQGVYSKFKQPIAHYFVKGTISSEKLMVIIKNIIKILSESGFTVISTVCDQGPTNIGALNLLKKFSGQAPDSNFFFVDDKKVYIIFDVPHLLKSIRNNFFGAGEIVFDNKKGKWSHLVELEQKNRETLHFKKITSLHVNPKFKAKMKVKLAAQIFSNDIAAILKLLAQTYKDEKEYDGTSKSNAILQTANIIEQIDKLFDVTNGPASRKDIKKGIRENVSKNSVHHALWPQLKKKIKTMHFLKSDSQLRLRNIRCVNGYYTTISSLECIWKHVESLGFKYLNLRQLNQDSLENLFGLIRQHSPTNQNPTCHHFTAALKSTILTKLSTPVRGSNCEGDDNQLMLDFHDLVFKNSEANDNIDAEHCYTSSFDEQEYVNSALFSPACDNDPPVLHLPEENEDVLGNEFFASFEKQPVVYVSGYLASVLVTKSNCEICCNSLRTLTPTENDMYSFIALKEWWKDRLSLTYPTLELCKTVNVSVSVFERDVKPHLFKNDISKYCHVMILKEVDLSWLCVAHKKDMTDMLLSRIVNLLIRNECRKLNYSISDMEQLNSDTNKRAQLMSTAK